MKLINVIWVFFFAMQLCFLPELSGQVDNYSVLSSGGMKLEKPGMSNITVIGGVSVSHGESAHQISYIFLHSVNHPPTDISLSTLSIPENSASNLFLAKLMAADQDTLNRISFNRQNGLGDAENARFEIRGDSLFVLSTFNFEEKATAELRLRVDDGRGGTFQKAFSIEIIDVNDPPVLAGAIANIQTLEDTPFELPLSPDVFFDEDTEDQLTYSLEGLGAGNLTFDPQSGLISGVPQQSDVGTYTLSMTATDNAGELVSTTFELEIVNVNDAPILVEEVPQQMALEDSPYTFNLPEDLFFDEDGDLLALEVTGLPETFVFDEATRSISGLPVQTTVGTYQITISATDPSGAQATASFSLEIQNVNDPPVFVGSFSDLRIDEDIAWGFSFPNDFFEDEDGDLITYQATFSNELTSFSFDPETRSFSGTPTQLEVGKHQITVSASDPEGALVSASFQLTILNRNDVPETGLLLIDLFATEDQPFEYVVPAASFIDQDQDALNFEVLGLPGSLFYHESSHLISGLPKGAEAGIYPIEVIAKDPSGATARQQIQLIIEAVNDAPVFVKPINDILIFEDSPLFELLITSDLVSDEEGDMVTFGFDRLPEGFTFTDQKLSVLPIQQNVGSYEFTLIANDLNGGLARQSFSVDVRNVNDAPVLTNAAID